MGDKKEEKANITAKGKVRDKIYVDGELVEDTGFRENVIVEDVNLLISALFSRNEPDHVGIQYWAVGEGLDEWDEQDPPDGDVQASTLKNEIDRLELGSDHIDYLDEDENVVAGITNKIRIVRVFGKDDANGTWMELGLFGGDAEDKEDTGILINHLPHPIIEKRENMTVERTLIITFE